MYTYLKLYIIIIISYYLIHLSTINKILNIKSIPIIVIV